MSNKFSHYTANNDLRRRMASAPKIDIVPALSKDLAIKLAMSELERARNGEAHEAYKEQRARNCIKNLLTGLGCEAVVEAWNECT